MWKMNLILLLIAGGASAQTPFEIDTIATTAGNVEITFIGHASLMLTFNGEVIQVDPYGKLYDYTKLHKADIILLTHNHQDHMDTTAINAIRTEQTKVILTALCAETIKGGQVLANGDTALVDSIQIIAVPAYNIVHKHDEIPFHPKGHGNGYILTFGATRIYIAGDTENTPEMKALKDIDVAFLPMNLPYTMTPEMVADAAKAFQPKLLYPYHYGDTDTNKLIELLKDTPEIDVRIRKMR
jgi:L-ascorbate metabolism protein UlaG (beta-lactamase superfamily)